MKNNRDKKVAALSYDFEDSAPRIVAKGVGLVAQNILQEAQKHNIPVYEDENLAKMLTQLEIGDHIPPELYEIVAQILIFITDMDVLQERVITNEKKQPANRESRRNKGL